MIVLTGNYKGRQILFIGLAEGELAGIKDSHMVSTLDAAMNPTPPFHYISIVRADTEAGLREMLERDMAEIVLDKTQNQPRPGRIERPS